MCSSDLLAGLGDTPTAAQILELKVCDLAMGSGAFLVEACRQLAEQVVAAWNRGESVVLSGEKGEDEPLLMARRLVAQQCLYGVDKNPFAVNLAKLSLWLVTLSRDVEADTTGTKMYQDTAANLVWVKVMGGQQTSPWYRIINFTAPFGQDLYNTLGIYIKDATIPNN